MARQDTVEIYSALEDQGFRIDADQLRRVAKEELGMVDGPIELNIFTKAVLATALQREQVVRNGELQKAMTEAGDWKAAMKNVAAVTELMENFGIADAQWSPSAGSKVLAPAEQPQPETGQQTGLNLDGQTDLPF